MEIFLDSRNIDRYCDLYLNENQEITTIDPHLYLAEFTDYINSHQGDLFICNREPYCLCAVDECDCNDDIHVGVSLRIDLVSNNQCILEIKLSKKIKLNKNYDWLIFLLDSSDQTSDYIDDINVIHIKLIERELKFINKTQEITFVLDDNPKKNDDTITIMFNYMNFTNHT